MQGVRSQEHAGSEVSEPVYLLFRSTSGGLSLADHRCVTEKLLQIWQ